MLSGANFRDTIAEMLLIAETRIPKDVTIALKRTLERERGQIPKLQLRLMLKNLELAKKFRAPICQDTGTFTFFIKIGRNLKLPFDLEKAITEGVTKATQEIPLRVNVVDPISRKPMKTNTGSAQPAVHVELVGGEEIQVELLVKGAGTENCGRLFMMRPVEGLPAIEQAVIKVLSDSGGRPCPPNIVGVGIGGSMETAPFLAKRALLRPINKRNLDPELAKLERKLEQAANELDVGPMGLGGRTTVLKVLVEKAACHTASLPVAVALQCWPARRARAIVSDGVFRVVEP